MRVVFDTNVLVSALVFPGGHAARALDRIVTEDHRLLTSSAIVDETLRVLARKFARDREALARTALLLDELCTRVDPTIERRVLADEPDNRILECAEAGDADVIVTGDKKMLALRAHEGIPIRTLRGFLEGRVS